MQQVAYMVESDSFSSTIFESWEELVKTLSEIGNPKIVLPIKISVCVIMKGEEDGSNRFRRDFESD